MRLSSLTTSQRRSTRPVNASSHIAEVRFDAKGLVVNAGLMLPATLGERLGLPELLRQHVDLGRVAGAANPDRKALTLIASLLAGGECVDDVNALRAGHVGAEVLGVRPAAASTVGTFLRAFTCRARASVGRRAGGSPSASVGGWGQAGRAGSEAGSGLHGDRDVRTAQAGGQGLHVPEHARLPPAA